jgi:hypothetical protein
MGMAWREMWRQIKEGTISGINSVSRYATDLVNRWRALWNGLKAIDWNGLGKYMMQGVVNGIYAGIAAVVAAAKKSALAAWEAFKNALNMHSPSKKFEWAGKMSMAGYMNGMSAAMDPAQIANIAARSVQNVSRNTQQSNTYNFASGYSTRDVQRLTADSARRIDRLEKMLGGK